MEHNKPNPHDPEGVFLEEEEEEEEEVDEEEDTLSLSDLLLHENHQIELPNPYPTAPFNQPHNFFEFSTTNTETNTTSSSGGDQINFLGKEEEEEEEEEQKHSSPIKTNKSSTNPFEEEDQRSSIFPLSSARLLNELLFYHSLNTSSTATVRPGNSGGGSFSSTKKHKMLIGLVNVSPKRELNDTKKSTQNQIGRSVVPMFSAVEADEGGPVVPAAGRGGVSRRRFWSDHVGPMSWRTSLARALTKASFGCIRLQ